MREGRTQMDGFLSCVVLVQIVVVALVVDVALSPLSAGATPSWTTLLSTTVKVGNGSAAVVSSAVLVSPDGKSWNFGVQIGSSVFMESADTGSGGGEELETPCTLGIFKVVGTASTWGWVAVNSTDMAFATVSFSAGSELQLVVDWRNGTKGSVVWSSGTAQAAQAVALTDDAQLLLLDAQNTTIWQRPGPLQHNAPLSICPSNLCLPPSPPPHPPPPPRSSSPPPAPPSGSTSLYPSLALLLLVLSMQY